MPRELKHLLLATTEDPFDIKSWSGIPFSLRTALERRVERVSIFRPPPPRRAPLDVAKRLLGGSGKFPLWITKATLRRNARTLRSEIERLKPEAVLSISSPCIAYLEKPDIPISMLSDAPYMAFCETYAQWQTPPRRIDKFAAEEARAARRLDGLFFSSDWACAEAKRLYELESAATLHTIPFGANWVPQLGRDAINQQIEERIARLATSPIELLFLGKDWERKGGPLAVEIASQISNSGRKVRLHVVGCRPELGEAASPDGFITLHGPLYQSNPAQSAQLAQLFLRSHLLVVPTLAECFGIVFAEAQAFGLPPVSRAVHAVPSIVLDSTTGLLSAPNAGAELYVERILALLADPEAYRSMAHRARDWFEQRLTWDSTAEAIVNRIAEQLTRVK